MRKLYTYPDKILRKKARPVENIDQEIIKLLEEMAQIMYDSKGIGLAAPQVGESKRLIVIDIGEGIMKLINPRVIGKKGRRITEEGCLSFPELGVKVCRAGQVKIKALDEKGKDIIIDAQDLLATVLQHEIDHLNGKLLIDYVSWPKRWFVVRKLKKAKCAL